MKFEKPGGKPDGKAGWGSDVAAGMLRRLGVRYISLNPGASYRGLHDSLVNHIGNTDPALLLCLHEDHAVGVAHGYAKVTGEPMACALHSNVGLMHGAMAIFNAWCDRAPIIIVGATGPVDAAKRRPWIDWVHTSADQAALVRDFLKWDAQPASTDAMIEAFCRANMLARTAPKAPVYVCLDAGLQEAAFKGTPKWPDMARFAPPKPPTTSTEGLNRTMDILVRAQRPVILCGRGRRTERAFAARIALAERLGAVVLSDYKVGSMFPTDHPAHPVEPFNKVGAAVSGVLADADAILALDWVDLGGLLAAGGKAGMKKGTPVISATLDHHLHTGAHMNHHMLAPVDVLLSADPDAVVIDLLDTLGPGARAPWRQRKAAPLKKPQGKTITLDHVADALRAAVADPDEIGFAALCRGWPTVRWPMTGPLAYFGKDGGGGIGSGPGIAVGVALALQDHNKKAIAVLGDGDCVMGITALWTAVHHQIPLLVIVNNNRSYYNDELHQETVAHARGRNPKNRWVGQRLSDPDIDFAKLAEAQGAVGIGPVTDPAKLGLALKKAVKVLGGGGVCVVDIHVTPGQDRKQNQMVQARK